jgi:phosphoribosyl 1,2-cyclic phosphodiesterase
MLTFSLNSGSNGNSIFVEACGTRLLFDAGISGKSAEGRLRVHGRNIRDIDALIISHEHTDHIRCAGVYHRRYQLPVHLTHATHEAGAAKVGPISDIRFFEAGDTLRFGGVSVHTYSTPHDAADAVAFVVEAKGRKLGILTDLGHVFDDLTGVVESLDAVYLESNYDEDMLEKGPYPNHLKERIRGDAGHISNLEAADLVAGKGRRLQWLALAHLSAENNCPDLARSTHEKTHGQDLPLYIASRTRVSPMLQIC